MSIIKKVILSASIFVIIFCFLGTTLKGAPNLQRPKNKELYKNKIYNISLEYNGEWKVNPKYIEKYEGKDGFFQISAYAGKGVKIDEIAQSEASHKLKPYGNSFKITKVRIQGQEARLIMPFNDQSQEFNNQAELIVKYPKEIKINGNTYNYFILWADKYNIQEISRTLKFIA